MSAFKIYFEVNALHTKSTIHILTPVFERGKQRGWSNAYLHSILDVIRFCSHDLNQNYFLALEFSENEVTLCVIFVIMQFLCVSLKQQTAASPLITRCRKLNKVCLSRSINWQHIVKATRALGRSNVLSDRPRPRKPTLLLLPRFLFLHASFFISHPADKVADLAASTRNRALVWN